MNALKSIYAFAGFSVALIVGIAVLNWTVDPQCFYHCDTLDVKRSTVNVYYHVAQKIIAHKDAEQVILGSSRGETTSPLWVQKITGLKTLNLSVGGAEMKAKLAFLKIADENLKLRRVIWLADYFELLTDIADAKIKSSPYLRSEIPAKLQEDASKDRFKDLLKLIDHKTLEATVHTLKKPEVATLDQGASSDADFELCASDRYKGKETPESLVKEVESIYQSYVHQIFTVKENADALTAFDETVKEMVTRGIEILIVVPPYNPTFLEKLKKEHPDVYQRHAAWIRKLASLTSPKIQLTNSFEGISGDDHSPIFWNDGVHFSCKGSQVLLEAAFK